MIHSEAFFSSCPKQRKRAFGVGTRDARLSVRDWMISVGAVTRGSASSARRIKSRSAFSAAAVEHAVGETACD